MFPGSRRLVERADLREVLQVEPRCWCGERGAMNARTVGGVIQREGGYEALCRHQYCDDVASRVANRVALAKG